MKICKRCDTEKPFSEFHKRSESKDGYQSYCKSCMRLCVIKTRSKPQRIPMPPVMVDKGSKRHRQRETYSENLKAG